MKRCAGGLLLRDCQVLLGRRAADRSLFPDTWDVFGGHVEAGERLADTLRRELDEEIEVTPTAFREIAVLTDRRATQFEDTRYHIVLASKWTGPGPCLRGTEHSELRWFPLKAAIGLDLAHPSYPMLLRNFAR